MKHTYNLASLEWTVEGYTPYLWLFERLYGGMGNNGPCIDVPAVPAQVPGSVQGALRKAGVLLDWNIGTNWRACEWVEHRHWMYRTHLPDGWLDKQATFRLECLGLDYSGWIYVNYKEVSSFKGTHLPHVFDITTYLADTDNVLEIIFDLPPRWLGQFGFTSQVKEWKTRFNYTWDWAPRLVQVGIWDDISLVAVTGSELAVLHCTTDADPLQSTGILELRGATTACNGETVRITLANEAGIVRTGEVTVRELQQGIHWDDLPIDLWWPNLEGCQPLYLLTCVLLDNEGIEQDRQERRIGFKHVVWQPCPGAPGEADPWLCVVNGRPVFLQGVNFSPLGVNYADLQREDYRQRLLQYKEMGLNLFRINACQFLERQWFYDLCDEYGLMVWQEFPLTSSGLDNWPPEDQASIDAVAEIAASYIVRRQHHVSLLLWSGGNELMGDMQGNKWGMGKPCDLSHPMIKRLQEVAQALDPGHRYIATSPSGPRAGASAAEFGQGLHWDVHGGAALSRLEDAVNYWADDDALFRSEVYCSGASPVALIEKYAGSYNSFPANASNPYWTRLTTWWIDWNRVTALHGREPVDLVEYVAWSQELQATMLGLEMQACKDRFPRCGGILLWSGHDTYPLTINTSLIDFDGHPKPSALAVAQVWHGIAGKLK